MKRESQSRRACAVAAALLAASGAALCAPGKTFVYCSEGGPEAFNPQITLSGTAAIATGPTIYDRLLSFKYGTTELEAGLADRWTVSADKTVYTLHLRKGVKFQSTKYFTPTRDFNASDVLFSFERQKNKDHAYHMVGGGAYQYFQGMGMDTLIKRVEQVDPYTVKLVLSRPDTPFLANLAMPFMSILSAEYGDRLAAQGRKNDIDALPIGTGPFAFSRYVKDSTIYYEANQAYWRGKPAIDKLIFSITPDASVRYQKLKKGECHLASYPAPADLARIEATPGLKLVKGNGMNISYLALNTEKPPFNNVLVRKAIAHALDKNAYIKAIFLGNAVPAKNPFPPSMWGYNDAVAEDQYDPPRARALLKQAGFPDGFSASLWTLPVARPYNPNGKKMGEMMQKDLAAVGIKVSLATYDWGTYLAKVKAGEHQIIQLGWTGDNGDPDNFLYTLLSCDSVTKGSNNARFCEQPFDGLIKAARVEGDPVKRLALYHQAQLTLKERAPIVPIAHALVYRAMSDKVTGYKMEPFDMDRFYMLDLRE